MDPEEEAPPAPDTYRVAELPSSSTEPLRKEGPAPPISSQEEVEDKRAAPPDATDTGHRVVKLRG